MVSLSVLKCNLGYTQPIYHQKKKIYFHSLTKVDLLRPLLGLILESPFYKSQCYLVDIFYTTATCMN